MICSAPFLRRPTFPNRTHESPATIVFDGPSRRWERGELESIQISPARKLAYVPSKPPKRSKIKISESSPCRKTSDQMNSKNLREDSRKSISTAAENVLKRRNTPTKPIWLVLQHLTQQGRTVRLGTRPGRFRAGLAGLEVASPGLQPPTARDKIPKSKISSKQIQLKPNFCIGVSEGV